MMNINLLAVVTTLYICHGCSTRETLWGGKFTVGNFSVMNMKNFGRRNVRRQREIKGSDKFITLEILLNFGIMENIRITSIEPKDNLEISGKGLITSLDLKYKNLWH